MGLLDQRTELIEPRVEELVGHGAAGKSAGIGKGNPLNALDALDVAKTLETRGIDRGGVARDPRMAVKQLLAATDAEGGLTRALRRELGTLDMEATDGDTIGFGHDNHAPKDRGYQTGSIDGAYRGGRRERSRARNITTCQRRRSPLGPAVPLPCRQSQGSCARRRSPKSVCRTITAPTVIHREYRPLELPFLVFAQPDC